MVVGITHHHCAQVTLPGSLWHGGTHLPYSRHHQDAGTDDAPALLGAGSHPYRQTVVTLLVLSCVGVMPLSQAAFPQGAVLDYLKAIREYVAAVIRADEEFDEHIARRSRDKEADGYRIVAGGQTGPHVDGLAPWELTDWRSGELVATGSGLESFQAQFEAERWWHIDSLAVDHVAPVPESASLPPGLARALADWASNDPVEAELWLNASGPPD